MATERILPAIALRAPSRPRPLRDIPGTFGIAGAPGSAGAPEVAGTRGRLARPAVVRREAILNTPARAGMLIGASAAIYAVTLTGVAALQARGDAELAAQRAPYLEAVSAARAANDALEAALLRANTRAGTLADDYARAGQDVGAYQARLDELAALVSQVQGSAAALPTRISLPTVSMRGAIAGASGSSGGAAPATSAKSGASGVP